MSGRWWLVGRIFHMRVVTLMVLVALFAWALYRFSRPTDRSLGYLRRKAMTAVAAKVADALPRHGQVRTLAVLPLDGDSDRLVRTFLVNQIREAKTIFQVTQADFMHRMQLEIQQPAKSMEEALVAAKLLGVDAVAFGRVPLFRVTDNESEIVVEMCVADRSASKPVMLDRFHEKVSGGLEVRRAAIADSSVVPRILVWCGFTLLLPFVLLPLVKPLLARESNFVNALLLGGLSLAAAGAAWALTGFWIASDWTWLMLAASLGLAAYWNYHALQWVDRFRY